MYTWHVMRPLNLFAHLSVNQCGLWRIGLLVLLTNSPFADHCLHFCFCDMWCSFDYILVFCRHILSGWLSGSAQSCRYEGSWFESRSSRLTDSGLILGMCHPSSFIRIPPRGRSPKNLCNRSPFPDPIMTIVVHWVVKYTTFHSFKLYVRLTHDLTCNQTHIAILLKNLWHAYVNNYWTAYK